MTQQNNFCPAAPNVCLVQCVQGLLIVSLGILGAVRVINLRTSNRFCMISGWRLLDAWFDEPLSTKLRRAAGTAAKRGFSYFPRALRSFVRTLTQEAGVTTSANKQKLRQRAGADVSFISQGRRSWAALSGKTSGIFKPAL